MQEMHERIIVSVGGSLIVPDAIDTDFLNRFKDLILEKLERGYAFAIIAGGGATARKYQDAAYHVHGSLSPEDLDWLGIHSTRLNGHLLRTIFRDAAYPVVVTNPDEVLDVPHDARIIVAGGYRPGASTDLRAVQIARRLGATKLANLSDIDYVYSADPKTDPEARALERVSWSDFRSLIPEVWGPGLSTPFDPIAAKEAQEVGLEVAVMNGAHLEEFGKYIDGKPFKGTIIS